LNICIILALPQDNARQLYFREIHCTKLECVLSVEFEPLDVLDIDHIAITPESQLEVAVQVMSEGNQVLLDDTLLLEVVSETRDLIISIWIEI